MVMKFPSGKPVSSEENSHGAPTVVRGAAVNKEHCPRFIKASAAIWFPHDVDDLTLGHAVHDSIELARLNSMGAAKESEYAHTCGE